MSVLAKSLRRLRQQAGTTPSPSVRSPAGIVGARHAGDHPERSPRTAARDAEAAISPACPRVADPTLRRLLEARALRTANTPATPRPFTHSDRELPGSELAPGLRYLEHFPGARAHSDHTLDLPALAARNISDAIARHQALFFDTETTGLAGGTGTRAFQIGAADWHAHPLHGDGLRVRQLLITTLAAETAMLREFAGWLSPTTVLSSYNGRCYDAPLLKTRYRLARLPCPITPLDHVDLLFPTRRRYRGVWENCRLATIERELLKIAREDDLPGSEAPAAWLSYLRGGPSTLLRRVCAHNHQDVVTLARLMLRLAEVEDAAAPVAFTS